LQRERRFAVSDDSAPIESDGTLLIAAADDGMVSLAPNLYSLNPTARESLLTSGLFGQMPSEAVSAIKGPEHHSKGAGPV